MTTPSSTIRPTLKFLTTPDSSPAVFLYSVKPRFILVTLLCASLARFHQHTIICTKKRFVGLGSAGIAISRLGGANPYDFQVLVDEHVSAF